MKVIKTEFARSFKCRGVFRKCWQLATEKQTWMSSRLETPFVLLVWRFWRRLNDLLFNLHLQFVSASKCISFFQTQFKSD